MWGLGKGVVVDFVPECWLLEVARLLKEGQQESDKGCQQDDEWGQPGDEQIEFGVEDESLAECLYDHVY